MKSLSLFSGLLLLSLAESSPPVQQFIIEEEHMAPESNEYIVETVSGKIRGFYDGSTVTYMGIPYGMPPVGVLRWNLPHSPPSWHPHVRDATTEPPGCPQINCETLTPPIACPKKTSEDCLYLNVFAPMAATNMSKLPVMVYIHGGNFCYMSGSSPLYNGKDLAERGNVIYVSMNYRLGALGFLVTGKKDTDAHGNYGLYDQILALKWVKENIQQFGGDPSKVTLFGQSAGGQSIFQHLVSEESSTLFHRAIAESSPLNVPYKTFSEAFTLGGLLAENLNCPVGDIVCLRAASAHDVTVTAEKTRRQLASVRMLEYFEPYGPYVDGTLVKGQPLELYRAGNFSKKPLILGTTSEETILFVYGIFKERVDLQKYITFITFFNPLELMQILDKYLPSATSTDQRETLAKLTTDGIFLCPNRNMSRLFVNEGQTDVWLYLWDHAFSFPAWAQATFCEGRVCHGSEIPFVFHTAYAGNFTFTPDEEVLSNDTMTFLTNFAKTGDPNNNGDKLGQDKMDVPLKWPKCSKESGYQTMHFKTPQSDIIQDYRGFYCDFWDSIGYGGFFG